MGHSHHLGERLQEWPSRVLPGSHDLAPAGFDDVGHPAIMRSRELRWHCWEPDPDRSTSLAIFMGLASTCEDDPEHLADYEREIRREAQKLIVAGDDNGP
jgi:hypothetical protein